MLQALSIRNFIIVESLDLEFAAGFTTLTGETGAGKSILIDALSLALGARNDGVVTRAGCDKAEICATFSVNQNLQAQAWLDENAFEPAGELMLRRVIYADGRSRSFINGVAATLSQLKQLGEHLVDIYSQNAHHSLLNTHTQRQILDAYAGASALAIQTADAYKAWSQLETQRLALAQNASAYAEELAVLRDELHELQQLQFSPEDWQSLQQEHSRLSHGATLISGSEASLQLLSEGELAVLPLLTQVQQQFSALTRYDQSLSETAEMLDSAAIQLQEAARALNRYLQHADLDPANLAALDARIQLIHGTARKYRLQPEDLPALMQQKTARMQDLAQWVDDGALAQQAAEALTTYEKLATDLSAKRQQAAKQLSRVVTQEMQRLSLSGGQFEVSLVAGEKTAHGLEQVEFLVAGHVGVAPSALNKVASGGELSRISLALHVCTAAQNSVPCMIFDEVDVGIGGGVAEVVGQLLQQLGVNRQVLVITHLPQVAALAAHHWQVSKVQANGQTLSHIESLNQQQRIEEIARMSGGLVVTEATRNHAKAMLGI